MSFTKILSVAIIVTGFCSMAIAQKQIQQSNQTQVQSVDYTKEPAWIKMIDDPNANYYEALKAYDTYWNGKLKPEEEADVINEHASKKEKREHEEFEKQLAKMTPAERNNYDEMKYQCKRFENWKHEVFPYVQEDGRILSQQERFKIYEQQQKEMQQQQPHK